MKVTQNTLTLLKEMDKHVQSGMVKPHGKKVWIRTQKFYERNAAIININSYSYINISKNRLQKQGSIAFRRIFCSI